MNQSASLAYSASLPAKRMASGCLFLNKAGELLIVKPVYRDDWLLPGGSLEKDESPAQGCAREDVLSLLAGKLAERMKFGFRALDENQVIYLEDKSETL
jgi:hypothetical protein